MQGKNKKLHPEDKQNLIIFIICAIGLFISYDIFLYQPKMERIRAAQESAANVDASTASVAQAEEPLTRDEALQGTNRIAIDSETLQGSINLTGGRIDDLALKKYMTEPQGDQMVNLLNPVDGPYSYYGEFGWLSQDPSLQMPSKTTPWQSNGQSIGGGETVELTWNNGQGLDFTNEISLDDKYMFSVNQSVRNNTGRPITVYPFALIGRTGLPEHMTGAFILHEGPIGYVGDTLHEVDYKDLDERKNEKYTANEGWIGFTDKYWLAALTTGKEYTDAMEFRFTGTPKSSEITHYQTDMKGTAIVLQPGEQITVPIEFFAGPKIVDMLEDYATQYGVPHFDLAVDFGIFYFLTRPFYEVLTFLNNSIGNFAIALLVFTVFIRAAVFPLAQKSFRSFARMSKVTPQMIEIREKYSNDRAKMQQAIFELYKRENVNPVAGCIPILIQIPIFFALYKVFYINIAMRHEPFWGWIDDMSVMDPTNLVEGFGLFPWNAPDFLHLGLWPIIMFFTLFLQQRLSPPPQDKTQRFMMAAMPFYMTFILAKFPAGLVIYWSWSNALSVLQQYVLLRQEGIHANIFTRSRTQKKLDKLVAEGPEIHPALEILDHDDIEAETKEIKPKTRKRKK